MVKDNASVVVRHCSEEGVAGALDPGHTDDEASDEEGARGEDESDDEDIGAKHGQSATRQIVG